MVVLHTFGLWSVVGCVVQIAAGEAIATGFGARPGVGAAAVVVAMLLQLVVMFTAVHSWPDDHPLLKVPLEEEDGDKNMRLYLVHSTETPNGETTQRQGNP